MPSRHWKCLSDGVDGGDQFSSATNNPIDSVAWGIWAIKESSALMAVHGLFRKKSRWMTMLMPSSIAARRGWRVCMSTFCESARGGPQSRPVAPGSAAVAILCLVLVHAAARAAAADPEGFRRLASGVLTVIAPDRATDNALVRADLLDVTEGQADLQWTPKVAAALTL